MYVLQCLSFYFYKFKNVYCLYILKYLYDFTNRFFVRDWFFKYKRFDSLMKLGTFCWLFSLPYYNYFKIKNIIFLFKSIKYNIFYLNSFVFYYFDFFFCNIRLYRLGLLTYIALAYFKYFKCLNMLESLRVNFVMLWGYYDFYESFDFHEFIDVSTKFRYFDYSIFNFFFNFFTKVQKLSVDFYNWKLYYIFVILILKRFYD